MVEASNSRLADVEKSLSFPLGAMSPLWLAFAGAAATGAAYFWMSRWTRSTNLEAEFGADKALPPAELPSFAPVASAAIEAAAAAVEPALEIAKTATHTVMQSAIEQSAAMAEAFDPVEPVPEPLIKAQAAVEEAAQAAVAATVETTKATAETAKAALDDLTRLVGVGPKLAASLAGRGVTRFSQIAAWTASDLDEVDQALDLRGRAVRDAWVAQAKRLSDAASPAV